MAGSNGGTGSGFADICPVSRVFFGFILARSLSWSSYLFFVYVLLT